MRVRAKSRTKARAALRSDLRLSTGYDHSRTHTWSCCRCRTTFRTRCSTMHISPFFCVVQFRRSQLRAHERVHIPYPIGAPCYDFRRPVLHVASENKKKVKKALFSLTSTFEPMLVLGGSASPSMSLSELLHCQFRLLRLCQSLIESSRSMSLSDWVFT